MNIYQKLAVATAGVALSFAPIEAKPAQAATITYNYTETPSTAGFYVSGRFSFDNSVGGTIFNVTDFTLAWNSSNGSPIAFFPNPNPFGFDPPRSLPVWDSSSGSLSGEYQQCGRVCTDNFFRNGQEDGTFSFPNGIRVSSGSVSYTQVPEPSGVAGLLVLGLGLLLKKKVASSART